MVEIETNLTYIFGTDDPCYDGITGNPCVDAGQFPVSYPQVEVKLKPFAIDRHEVTNFQYEYCVAMGACSEPLAFNAQAPEQLDYYASTLFQKYPVVNITYQQAKDYCTFVGRRLVSEFEWERVAKGPDPDNPRRYPAEDVDEFSDCKSPNFAAYGCRLDARLDPTNQPKSDFVLEGTQKIHHMFANAAEWVQEFYDPNITCAEELPSTCTPCSECNSTDTLCQNNCKSCAKCVQDQANTGGLDDEGIFDCHYVCEGQSKQYPLCIKHSLDVQPIEIPSPLLQPASAVEGGRIVRGGSVLYGDQQSCRFRSAYREFWNPVAEPQPHVGFRCARTL